MPLLKHIEFLLINMINYIVILCSFQEKHYYLVKLVLVFIHAMIDLQKKQLEAQTQVWRQGMKIKEFKAEKYKSDHKDTVKMNC